MKKILPLISLILLFFCSKSESTNPNSSLDIDSNQIETFGDWSPDFKNQTSNFTQIRTGSKGNNETREINVTKTEEVILSIESNQLVEDINEDGDNYDITSQKISTYTASEGLGTFITSGTISIKSDIDITLKNSGNVNIDITSLSNNKVIINAIPSNGYKFLGWDGPSVLKPTSVNPLEIDIKSDKEIKANFLNINDPDYSGIGFYADPIFSKIDHNNLFSYLEAFILDAERYGVDLSYINDACINLFFDENYTGAGATNAFCKENQVRVLLGKAYWDNQLKMLMSKPYSNPLYSETTIFGFHLMWHELGHDILNIGHTCNDTPNFINYPGACDKDSEITLQYTRDMLWFTDNSNPETSEENNGFHNALYNYYNKINQIQATTYGLSCPCPSIETCIDSNNVTCGWKWSKTLGESIIPSDWCFTQDTSYLNYSSEYLGPCTDDKSVPYTIDTNQLICEDVHL